MFSFLFNLFNGFLSCRPFAWYGMVKTRQRRRAKARKKKKVNERTSKRMRAENQKLMKAERKSRRMARRRAKLRAEKILDEILTRVVAGTVDGSEKMTSQVDKKESTEVSYITLEISRKILFHEI